MLAVLVPTRGRPHVVRSVVEAVAATRSRDDTELWFGVDADDPAVLAYYDAVGAAQIGWVRLVERPTHTMVESLNALAAYRLQGDLPHGSALMFMGDDHRPRTPGWDQTLLDAATGVMDWAPGPGIAYGNDLLQSANLPTQVCIDARIVAELDHMAAPTLTHLYVDNYWRKLGIRADCLRYLPAVVIEHLHPVAGKAAMDAGYERVNSGEMYARDADAFDALDRDGAGALTAEVRAIVALRKRVLA
jgi:hypothetical protein